MLFSPWAVKEKDKAYTCWPAQALDIMGGHVKAARTNDHTDP